jgi:hypothetical protein
MFILSMNKSGKKLSEWLIARVLKGCVGLCREQEATT